jgi:hypothetical protein
MIAGYYDLLTITVGEEAAIPVFEEVVFTTTFNPAYIQSLVEDAQDDIDDVEESVATLEDTLNTAINDLRNMQYIAIGLAVISILIALGAFMKR